MRKKTKFRIKPPFLKTIKARYDKIESFDEYPFCLPLISKGDFEIEFTKKVTVIVGDNGTGKSTILEAIAKNCGFSLTGGNRNFAHMSSEGEMLSDYLRMAWSLKMGQGFFIRAETLFSFIENIDLIGAGIHQYYGGKSLKERSHGESFIQIFENKFGKRGIYILDEPEAALSPKRQREFIKLIHRLNLSDQAQVIIATHSPLIMAYPDCQLLSLSNDGIKEIKFHDTDHFKLLRDFYLNPDGVMQGLCLEVEEENEQLYSA